MPPAIRVEMTPLESAFGRAGQSISDGASVSLIALGPFGTELSLDEPKPAKLLFEARFIERLRGGNDEPRALASLEGELLLGVVGQRPSLVFEAKKGADGKALGLVPEEPVDEAEEEAEAGGEDPDPNELRVLRFAFDTVQFPGLEAAAETNQLLFRLDPTRFACMEVGVTLEVAGTEEAPSSANDFLDVLVTARNPGRREIVVLRLTDEAGEVMPGASCRILGGATPAQKGADPAALTANGDGEVRLKTQPGATFCEVAWRKSGTSEAEFKRKLFLDLGDDPDEAQQRRLHNLGYTAATLEENVLAFQGDFGRPATGRLGDIAAELRAFHDDGVRPEQGDATGPSSEPIAVNDVPSNRDFDDLFGASEDSAAVAVA